MGLGGQRVTEGAAPFRRSRDAKDLILVRSTRSPPEY